jgi:dipeptidyl aminopeptidase/acylaminoacyl peptidase
LASPVSHVYKDAPPLLILHGTADQTVSVEQSERLAKALSKVDARHQLVLVEGAPHSFHLEPKEKDLRPLVLGFFGRYLKP